VAAAATAAAVGAALAAARPSTSCRRLRVAWVPTTAERKRSATRVVIAVAAAGAKRAGALRERGARTRVFMLAVIVSILGHARFVNDVCVLVPGHVREYGALPKNLEVFLEGYRYALDQSYEGLQTYGDFFIFFNVHRAPRRYTW